jgi:hypothetical protein
MHGLADSYTGLGQHAEALKLNEETLALRRAQLGQDHPYTLLSMEHLAGSYTALSRHAEAVKLLEEVLRLRSAKLGSHHREVARTVYNIACLYALMIPRSPERAHQADLAMGWLRKAVAAGYKDVNHMKKDKDLDGLHGRADFQKLLDEMEAGNTHATKGNDKTNR